MILNSICCLQVLHILKATIQILMHLLAIKQQKWFDNERSGCVDLVQVQIERWTISIA